jgi:hypothetical protein
MSIFRFRNSKVYWMDFFFHGQRIQESTGTRRRVQQESKSGSNPHCSPLRLRNISLHA